MTGSTRPRSSSSAKSTRDTASMRLSRTSGPGSGWAPLSTQSAASTRPAPNVEAAAVALSSPAAAPAGGGGARARAMEADGDDGSGSGGGGSMRATSGGRLETTGAGVGAIEPRGDPGGVDAGEERRLLDPDAKRATFDALRREASRFFFL
jgi:hypothetical protein